jgi:hypothetical protein
MLLHVMEQSGHPFGQPGSTGEDDRRGEPRIGCHKQIQIILSGNLSLTDCKTVPAELIDAAAQGIGIIYNRPMQPGEQFILRVQFNDGARLLIYTVRHSQWLSLQRYQIGAQFSGFLAVPTRMDPGTILQALLALEA